jgi:hypothetical protein
MSVQACTFFPDFPEGYQAPLTLAFTTDTQTPQTLVPVFLIHSLEAPFCHNPRCVCQEQRRQKIAMLASIAHGETTLHASTRFHDVSEEGKR